jgi:hypothetical protein
VNVKPRAGIIEGSDMARESFARSVYTLVTYIHSYPIYIYITTQQSLFQLFYSDILISPLSILGSKEHITKGIVLGSIIHPMRQRIAKLFERPTSAYSP